MELIIKIPDKAYELLKNKAELDNIAESIIANGTPLPKGHGRLIDADKLDTRERGNNSQRTMWWKIECIIQDAPTIIEADESEEEE